MYEELVERLKIAADWAGKGFCITPSLCLEAADVIEGLSGLIDHYGGETGIKNLEEYAKKYWDTLTKIPRWIPVTETLPKCEWGVEVGNIVWISCGMVFAGCFGRGGKYRDAYFRTWTDGTEGIDAKDADYWRQIQIPELPKEGT